MQLYICARFAGDTPFTKGIWMTQYGHLIDTLILFVLGFFDSVNSYKRIMIRLVMKT